MSSLEHAPWRRADAAQREPSDRDVRLAIVAALDAHPGIAQDDIMYLLDMPQTRPAEARVKRLLDGLVEENEVERWLDHNERPAAWRYWLRGGRPPTPDARAPLRPKPAPSPSTVQEIVKDVTPAPAAVRLSELRGDAPPARAEDVDVEVAAIGKAPKKATAAPAAPRVARLDAVLVTVEKHPAGVNAARIAELLGRPPVQVAGRLHHLTIAGKVRREGNRGSYVYYPLAPRAIEAGAAPSPAPEKVVKPARAKPRARPPPGSPRPLDLDAIEQRLARLRELRAELDEAEASLRALVGGAS